MTQTLRKTIQRKVGPSERKLIIDLCLALEIDPNKVTKLEIGPHSMVIYTAEGS